MQDIVSFERMESFERKCFFQKKCFLWKKVFFKSFSLKKILPNLRWGKTETGEWTPQTDMGKESFLLFLYFLFMMLSLTFFLTCLSRWMSAVVSCWFQLISADFQLNFSLNSLQPSRGLKLKVYNPFWTFYVTYFSLGQWTEKVFLVLLFSL